MSKFVGQTVVYGLFPSMHFSSIVQTLGQHLIHWICFNGKISVVFIQNILTYAL